jgi:hypothetical protein
MPHTDTPADAAGCCLHLSPAGHVHVQDGIALIVGKNRSHTSHFMNVIQNTSHGFDRRFPTLLGTHNQRAAFIRATEDNQGGSSYGLLPYEVLDDFMNNVSVLKPDYKDAAVFCLGIFHRVQLLVSDDLMMTVSQIFLTENFILSGKE